MTVRFLLVFACLALTACGGVRHHHRHTTVPETVVINLPPNAIRVYGGYYMLPLPQQVQGCPAYRAHSTTGTPPQTIYFRSFDGRFVLTRPVNCTTIAIAAPPGHIPPGLIGNPGRGPVVGGNPPGHGGDVVIRPPTPRGGPGVTANAGGGQGLGTGSISAGGAPPILPGNNTRPRNGNAGGGQGLVVGSTSAGGAPPILPGNNTRPRNGNAGGGQGPATGSTSAGGAPPTLPGNNGQRGNGNAGGAPACPDAAGAGRGSPPHCR